MGLAFCPLRGATHHNLAHIFSIWCVVKLAQGEGALEPQANFSLYKQGLRVDIHIHTCI